LSRGRSAVSGLWRRFREASRTAGAARAVAAAPLWLVRPRYFVVRFNHGPKAPYPPGDLDGLEVRRVGGEDFERLAALEPGLSGHELGRRLDEGLEGRLVLEGGEPVYVRWDAWADHLLTYLGTTFRLRGGDHHPALAFTRPDRRRAGVHGRLLAWSLGEARRRGCRRSFGLVAAWNVPSARAVAKPGWTRVGAIGRWSLGPAVRFVASGAVRLGPGPSFEIGDGGEDRGPERR